MKYKLQTKMERCSKLEVEIVSIRKELEKANEQVNKSLKLKGGTNILDELLSTQKLASKEKYGLGIEKGMSSFVDTCAKLYERFREEENSISKDEKSNKEDASRDEEKLTIVEKSIKEKEISEDKKVKWKNLDQQKKKQNPKRTENDGFTRLHYPTKPKQRIYPNPSIRYTMTRYSSYFNGYCYTCNNFGHRARECKVNLRRNINFMSKNPFSPLIDVDVVCFNYNNFGHIARDCRKNFRRQNTQFEKKKVEVIKE